MKVLTVRSAQRTQLLDITPVVRRALVGELGIIAHLFVPHTTAGLVLQAAGDGATKVAADIESALERLVGEDWKWEHTTEGDQNPSSHVRASLTASSVAIPIHEGRLALGAFQAIFLCEFDGPRERRILLSVS